MRGVRLAMDAMQGMHCNLRLAMPSSRPNLPQEHAGAARHRGASGQPHQPRRVLIR
jgi:hypothetical protein